jgi:molecular chaperone DnaK
LLGEFKLDGIQPQRRGQPQIEVTFDIDANGIMHIAAKDKITGKENKITIKSDSGLTKEEIDRMVREGEENAEADKAARDLIEARNQSETMIHNVRNDLSEVEATLTEEEKTKVTEAITKAEEDLKGEDADTIRKSAGDLFQASQPVMTAKAKLDQEKAEASKADAEKEPINAEFTEDQSKAA